MRRPMLPDHLPQTDQLLGVLTVARLGSFTRAAHELGLSQPALSRQVMSLEKKLGIRLFDRVGRTVRLTGLGEELVARVGPLLEELSSVTVNLTASSTTSSGRVRLGASESVAVHALPNILRSFLNMHKRVSLRLVCHTSERLPEMVANGEIDIAITAIDFDVQSMSVTPLWDEDFVLVLPVGHQARSRSVQNYASEDFILLHASTITRRLLDRALAEQGIDLNVSLEHTSPEVIKAMVSAGLGLSILPEPIVRREVRRGELSAWPLADLRLSRSIVAITDPRRQPWPAESALLDTLMAYGRQ
ncbi:MAG: LysR family transcriptional regulator [Planctomycetota bacterium]